MLKRERDLTTDVDTVIAVVTIAKGFIKVKLLYTEIMWRAHTHRLILACG